MVMGPHSMYIYGMNGRKKIKKEKDLQTHGSAPLWGGWFTNYLFSDGSELPAPSYPLTTTA